MRISRAAQQCNAIYIHSFKMIATLDVAVSRVKGLLSAIAIASRAPGAALPPAVHHCITPIFCSLLRTYA
jgi:hypothetical protein